MLRVSAVRPVLRPYISATTLRSVHTAFIMTTSPPVRKVPLPSESTLQPLYKSAYFIDAFAVTLPNQQKAYAPDTLARAFFSQPPAWFSLLMWIRDHIMPVFRVKSSTQIQTEAKEKGVETISAFPVISRSDREIILGEDDSHLNFFVSFLVRDLDSTASIAAGSDEKEKELVAMTVVHCHGWLGKSYIAVIKPFHILIVKYNLAKLPRKLEER